MADPIYKSRLNHSCQFVNQSRLPVNNLVSMNNAAKRSATDVHPVTLSIAINGMDQPIGEKDTSEHRNTPYLSACSNGTALNRFHTAAVSLDEAPNPSRIGTSKDGSSGDRDRCQDDRCQQDEPNLCEYLAHRHHRIVTNS